MSTIQKWTIAVFLCFFIVGVSTLTSYGISWDEPNHFIRGQAYLNYFLTGNKDYSNLPAYNEQSAREDPNYHERSYYQIDQYDYNWQIVNDNHHPVLNDILASLTNYAFYQKLGWVSEVPAYHLFGVFASAILVATIFAFGYKTFGLWHGLFAALVTSTYPLFWGESHFNVKDPPEAAAFALVIYFVWSAFNYKNANHITLAGLFAGVALSIKFNILFAPFVVVPWLFYLIWKSTKTLKFTKSKTVLISGLIGLTLIPLIFFVHWPYLWQDLVENTAGVFAYYKDIGLESSIVTDVSRFNLNWYAPKWILFTTPPLVLVALVLAVYFSRRKLKEKSCVLLLWWLWFLVPIARVVFPGTTIYGGVRQIMEFIPALALLAGFGIVEFTKILGKKAGLKNGLLPLVFVATGAVLIATLIKFHPNENVYFNFLSGGVKGAMDAGIPSAGSSFGNAYKQATDWVNENAESGAKLALLQGTSLNVPRFTVRSDINYSNDHWSSSEKKGEYLIELTHNWNIRFYEEAWDYVERELIPVHEVVVDGAVIAKVWKNDIAHSLLVVDQNTAR